MPYSHWHILGCEAGFQRLAIMAGIRTDGRSMSPCTFWSTHTPQQRSCSGCGCYGVASVIRQCATQERQVRKCSVNTQSWRGVWRLKFYNLSRDSRLCHLGFPWREECSVGNLPEATDWWATPPKFLVQKIWGHFCLDQVTRWCWCNWSRHRTLSTGRGDRWWNVFCSKDKPVAAQTQLASFLRWLPLFLICSPSHWRVLGHSFMEGTHFCPPAWHSLWVRGRVCSLSSMRSSKFCSHGCL